MKHETPAHIGVVHENVEDGRVTHLRCHHCREGASFVGSAEARWPLAARFVAMHTECLPPRKRIDSNEELLLRQMVDG